MTEIAPGRTGGRTGRCRYSRMRATKRKPSVCRRAIRFRSRDRNKTKAVLTRTHRGIDLAETKRCRGAGAWCCAERQRLRADEEGRRGRQVRCSRGTACRNSKRIPGVASRRSDSSENGRQTCRTLYGKAGIYLYSGALEIKREALAQGRKLLG